MIHPTRENVFMLTDDKGARKAIIINKDIYTLSQISGEDIAELFNGGVLPIIPDQLGRTKPE